MLTVETLRDYGANVKEGLGRCLNSEAFYLKMVRLGLSDENFEKLRTSVEKKDAVAAFEAAHALKGSIGNLALTPIFNPVCELVELLRGKKEMVDTGTLGETILSEREKMCKLDA